MIRPTVPDPNLGGGMSPDVERIRRKINSGEPFRAHDATILYALVDATRFSSRVFGECIGMHARAGRDHTTKSHRPFLLIEVDKANEQAFFAEAAARDDVTGKTVRRVRRTKSLSLIRESRTGDGTTH
jgi:hypothetical protein